MTLARKVTAEALGTLLLLAAVVGSGIMGERLSGGNVAIALLANTVATVRHWSRLSSLSAAYPARISILQSHWRSRWNEG
jgi:hypothetical protein